MTNDMTTETGTATAISAALKRHGLDAEIMDTGGGILVTAAVYLRAGETGAFLPGYGETAHEGAMLRYFGITREEGWIVCEYREDSDDVRYTDGVLIDDAPALPPLEEPTEADLDRLAAFVAELVADRTGADMPAPTPPPHVTEAGLSDAAKAIIDAAEEEWYRLAQGELVMWEDDADPLENNTVKLILAMAEQAEASHLVVSPDAQPLTPEQVGFRVAAAFMPLVFGTDDEEGE